MAFLGCDTVRLKIVIGSSITEQVREFRYLGRQLSYENKVDMENKLNKFQRSTGIIKRSLKFNLQREGTQT